MSTRWTLSGLSLAGIVLCGLSGCESPSQPTPQACPTTSSLRSIPINVIRVLDDNGDSPGSSTNKGCRLSNAQITAYIQNADQFYRNTCNIALTWNSSIADQVVDLDDMVPFGCTARNRNIGNAI